MNKNDFQCDAELPALPINGVPEYNGENFRKEMFKAGGWLAMEGNRVAQEATGERKGPVDSNPPGGLGILSPSMNHTKMSM